MDFNKDYYVILGVHPSVEKVVIDAAYKALAKRYHPDKNQNDPETTKRQMQEINEAYEILSNEQKRREYDENSENSNFEFGDSNDSDTSEQPEYDPLEQDWKIITEYYPNSRQHLESLSNINWKLGYAFKAYIVESKDFHNFGDVAEKMKDEFLERYFGDNDMIREFVESLIEKNEKNALKELNKVVNALGINKEFDRTEDVINRITYLHLN